MANGSESFKQALGVLGTLLLGIPIFLLGLVGYSFWDGVSHSAQYNSSYKIAFGTFSIIGILLCYVASWILIERKVFVVIAGPALYIFIFIPITGLIAWTIYYLGLAINTFHSALFAMVLTGGTTTLLMTFAGDTMTRRTKGIILISIGILLWGIYEFLNR